MEWELMLFPKTTRNFSRASFRPRASTPCRQLPWYWWRQRRDGPTTIQRWKNECSKRAQPRATEHTETYPSRVLCLPVYRFISEFKFLKQDGLNRFVRSPSSIVVVLPFNRIQKNIACATKNREHVLRLLFFVCVTAVSHHILDYFSRFARSADKRNNFRWNHHHHGKSCFFSFVQVTQHCRPRCTRCIYILL